MNEQVQELAEELGIELADNETLLDYRDEIGMAIVASLNTDVEKLRENIIHNCTQHEINIDWPYAAQTGQKIGMVWPNKPQDTILGICAGGPSLLDTLEEARRLIDEGGKLIALANTMHVLLDHGLTPSAQVILDAKPRNAEFLHEIPGCTYFIASQADPSVFDKVLSFDNPRVYLWHAINNSEELIAVMDSLKVPWARIQGGSTITLRSLQLFKVLGYHRFEMFGMDSCWLGEEHHAYPQPAADHFKRAMIACNGRDFSVSGWMVNQAMEFLRFCKMYGAEMDMRVHGDGLIAHMVRSVAQAKEAA